VREEDLRHEITPAAHAGLLEDALEVLLDGVGRDDQPLGDLRRRLALEHEPRDLLFSLRQPVCGHEKW
jgi:hypothetical protein